MLPRPCKKAKNLREQGLNLKRADAFYFFSTYSPLGNPPFTVLCLSGFKAKPPTIFYDKPTHLKPKEKP
jgi:hypothetical protein